MDTTSQFIAAGPYRSTLVDWLVSHGLQYTTALQVVESRFPMPWDGALAELRMRGLELSRDDLAAFLAELYPSEGLGPDEIAWDGGLVEALAWWSEQRGRGQSVAPSAGPQNWTLEDMFRGLRSGNLIERVQAGFLLAQSAGVGLALEGRDGTDVHYLIAPQLSQVLGEAMAGTPGAVDRLEPLFRPATKPHIQGARP